MGMRASELEGKEVIELRTGERLGTIKDWELMINTETGQVDALLLVKHGWGNLDKSCRSIPWTQIRKISHDLLLFEEDPPESTF
jgi:YlmC/YmxH family sporulation protein